MIKGILSIFTGNLIGKVLGVLREVIVAGLYGTSGLVGAYRISQSASLIPVNFFTSDTLNSGFIPLFKKYKAISDEKAQSFFWILQFFLGSIVLIISIFLNIFASKAVIFIAPGISLQDSALAAQFVEVMALGLPFYVLSALYANMAMANNQYFLISIRPTIQSLGMISGVLLAYWLDNLMYFAWGFTVAYILLFVLSVFELLKRHLFWFSFIDLKETITEFWKVIKPLLWLPFFLQGNIIIEKIVASYMGIETVAAVDYAKFITETGIVLLAIPIAYVGLSELSNLGQKETKEKLTKIIPVVLLFTLPMSFFLFWNSEIIISIVFERGAFNQESVSLTSLILMGLSIGFWAQVISYVLIKALSASFRNKEVLIYMLISLSLSAAFNIAFYQQLGVITLGLGVSVYGISLLLFTLHAYRLLYHFIPIFMLVILGGVVYSFLVNQFVFDDLFTFVLSCIFFGFYWLIFFLLVPNTRLFVMQFLLKIRAKYNRE